MIHLNFESQKNINYKICHLSSSFHVVACEVACQDCLSLPQAIQIHLAQCMVGNVDLVSEISGILHGFDQTESITFY